MVDRMRGIRGLIDIVGLVQLQGEAVERGRTRRGLVVELLLVMLVDG
jgi:hypothetical protein